MPQWWTWNSFNLKSFLLSSTKEVNEMIFNFLKHSAMLHNKGQKAYCFLIETSKKWNYLFNHKICALKACRNHKFLSRTYKENSTSWYIKLHGIQWKTGKIWAEGCVTRPTVCASQTWVVHGDSTSRVVFVLCRVMLIWNYLSYIFISSFIRSYETW